MQFWPSYLLLKVPLGLVNFPNQYGIIAKVTRPYINYFSLIPLARGFSYTSRSYSTEEWSLGRKKIRIIGIAY